MSQVFLAGVAANEATVPNYTTAEAGNPFVAGWYADPDTAFFEGEYGRLRALLATGGDELLLVTNETDSRGSPDEGDDRILRLRIR